MLRIMRQTHAMRWRLVWSVTLPLLCGGSIYILFRSEDLLMFRWLAAFDLLGTARDLRAAVAGVRVPASVVYTAPTALWAYAMVSFVALLWNGRLSWARTCWLAVTCSLAIGSEVLQLMAVIPGTFDVVDFFGVGMATIAALLLNRESLEGPL